MARSISLTFSCGQGLHREATDGIKLTLALQMGPLVHFFVYAFQFPHPIIHNALFLLALPPLQSGSRIAFNN